MSGIALSQAQRERLAMFERDDPGVTVVGALQGCPVIRHSGIKRTTGTYSHLALLAPTGRLRGLGEAQRFALDRTKR
jgi:hypothetical protein